jgi:hypothetical protein
MIGLENLTPIIPGDSDFPDGQIKDKNGTVHGTPMNQRTFSDIFQFFQKLMRLAGIVPSGLFDCEYTGFQLISALQSFINGLLIPFVNNYYTSVPWITVGAGGPAFASGWSALGSPFRAPQFRKLANGIVQIRGSLTQSLGGGGTMFTFPSGYFNTSFDENFPAQAIGSGGSNVLVYINIDHATGNVSVNTGAVNVGQVNIGNLNYHLT